MNYDALKLELAKPEYAGLSDGEAAAAVAAKTVALPQAVPIREVRAVLYARGKWNGIVKRANAARANSDTSDAALICQTIYDLANGVAIAEMGDGGTARQVVSDLAALVGDGVLEENDRDTLLAMAKKTVPLVDTIGCRELAVMDDASAAFHVKTARVKP